MSASPPPDPRPVPPPRFTPWAGRAVWWRAARIALPIGLVQVAVNQGDHWMNGEITAGVIAKSLATPLVSLTVALLASTRPAPERQIPPTPPTVGRDFQIPPKTAAGTPWLGSPQRFEPRDPPNREKEKD